MLPPGPFPPHGDEADGVIDLGVRVRDQLLRGEVLAGGVRNVLANRVQTVSQSGRLMLSPGLVESLLHTWPLAAMIDGAVERWRAGPDGAALAIIARATTIVSSALGWPLTIDRTWPMPDPEWIEREAGPGPHIVVSRGPRDGAPAVAAVLKAPLATPRPLAMPPSLIGQGDEIAAHLDAWSGAASRGEAVAVRFETPVPWDATSRDALARLEAVAPAQVAWARYGHAGLFCPGAPEFEALLGRAPASSPQDPPVPKCDALVLPHVDDDGRTSLVGALCWDGPYAPVLVHPFAIDVMRALRTTQNLSRISRDLQLADEALRSIVGQLRELGAV